MSGGLESEWKFDQEPNVAAVTSVNVIEHGYPILIVTHYEDDHSWAFLCGTAFNTADGRLIGMGTALQMDPTLNEIADLPPGWSARRAAVGEKWIREQDEQDS